MALHLLKNSLVPAKLPSMVRFSSHAAHKFSNALKNAPETNQTELNNGIRVVTEKTNSLATTVGVWVEGGPRYEPKELNGITYFLENVLFKGSKSRQPKQVEQDVFDLGGIINSKVGREFSGFYATIAPNNTARAVELLTDLVQNPAFNQESVDTARKVILQELENSEQNYEQVVSDYLHSVAYQQVSLAQSKYGPTENIKKFTKDDLERAVDLLFKGPQLIVSASGNVSHDDLVKQVSKSLSGIKIEYEKNAIPSFPKSRYTGSDIRVRDDSMNCAHVAVAVEGPGYSSPDYVAMEIASNLFGKWDITHGGGINASNYMGMISAAEHLAQSFQGFNLTYKDTALFGSYFVGERMQLEELLWQLQYQWKRLCHDVTNNEIKQGKNNLFSRLVTERESSVSNANSLAKDVLRFGRRISLEEWERLINEVNSKKIHQVASHYIWDRCPTISALGPVENLPNYEEIRMKMSWMRY